MSLRDQTAAHATLGPATEHTLGNAGIVTASFGAIGFFLTPWLVRLGGYPAATTALLAVSVPMAASILGRRCWATSRLLGALSLGELLAKSYGRGVALLAGAILCATAIGLLALILLAGASLITLMSNGAISPSAGIAMAAVLIILTGAPAGFRAVGQLARLHTVLALSGAVGTIAMVVGRLGGWDGLATGLTRAARQFGWGTTGGRGGGEYNLVFAVAGSIGPGETWNGMTILSIQFAIGATLLLIVWLPWTIATTDPRHIGRQVTLGASWGGFLLIALTLVLGMAALWIDRTGVAAAPIVPFPWLDRTDIDVAQLLTAITREYVWAEVIIGLGGSAALQAIALVLLGSVTAALRPMWLHRTLESQSIERNIVVSQMVSSAIVVCAVLLLILPADLLMTLNTLSLSYAPLIVVPVVSACWFPSLTRQGLLVGMLAGLAVATAEVFLPIVSTIAVHAAAMGAAATIFVAIVVSRTRPRDNHRAVRADAAAIYRDIFAPSSEDGPSRHTTAILAAFLWVFFAIGPGIVVGNDLLGAPDLPRTRWDFSIPSIAVWQLLAWATGATLVWYLAHGVGLARVSRAQMDQIMARRTSR